MPLWVKRYVLLALVLALAGTAALGTAEKSAGAGWRYREDAQGAKQWYWAPYTSAHTGEDTGEHPVFRGTAYGIQWNYSLTLGWNARPLWLMDGDTKVLFRQNVEAGQPQDIIQLTLWTRTHYPGLQICMEPDALDVLTRNGIDEILLQNGGDPSVMEVTRYVVDSLVQMMEKTGRMAEISQIWLGDPAGPTLVFAGGGSEQLQAGADGAAEVPGAPS